MFTFLKTSTPLSLLYEEIVVAFLIVQVSMQASKTPNSVLLFSKIHDYIFQEFVLMV